GTDVVCIRKYNGEGTFSSEVTYEMGESPRLFLLDMNDDDLLDLVTANIVDNDISVRLNDLGEPGTFLGRVDYASDTIDYPSAISMGDVDGDGDNDIVVTNTIDDKIEIFKFIFPEYESTGTYSVGEDPIAFTFTDVDKDDDLDVVTANRGGNSITVLLNDGTGDFTDDSFNYKVGDNPSSVDAGDVDGDSDIDLIVGNKDDDTISILKNNGFGGFGFREDYNVLPLPLSVSLGDIDDDGDLDIAYATDENISFLYNRNGIDFIGDTDRDGYPDYQDDFPENRGEWVDSDGDGYGDNMDGIPWNPFEYIDSDNDGLGDNEDNDDDNDGYSDDLERIYGNDPYDASDHPPDFDSDYIPDDRDDDDDNDGFTDTIELSLGYNSKDADDVPPDYDNDGMPDAVDFDDDNDGVPDYDDYEPLNENVQKDPNLYRFWGVEIELGELAMAIMMGIGAVFLGSIIITRKKRRYKKYKRRIDECESPEELKRVNHEMKSDTEKERLTYIQVTLLKEQYKHRIKVLS
ncbi:MAG: VCBS repeat-containing protein, partial [Methanomassiliicoccales archaeon]